MVSARWGPWGPAEPGRLCRRPCCSLSTVFLLASVRSLPRSLAPSWLRCELGFAAVQIQLIPFGFWGLEAGSGAGQRLPGRRPAWVFRGPFPAGRQRTPLPVKDPAGRRVDGRAPQPDTPPWGHPSPAQLSCPCLGQAPGGPLKGFLAGLSARSRNRNANQSTHSPRVRLSLTAQILTAVNPLPRCQRPPLRCRRDG